MERVQISAMWGQSRKGAACKPRREPSPEHDHACVLILDPNLGLPTSRIVWEYTFTASVSQVVVLLWQPSTDALRVIWVSLLHLSFLLWKMEVKRWSHHRVAVKTKQDNINAYKHPHSPGLEVAAGSGTSTAVGRTSTCPSGQLWAGWTNSILIQREHEDMLADY